MSGLSPVNRPMPCVYLDRIYFCAVHLFTLPIKTRIILPCCNSPKDSGPIFRREHFLEGRTFSLEKYFELLGRHCVSGCCPNYKEGTSIINEIVLGEWRKCPGKCLTCFNCTEDNRMEFPLSPEALKKYLSEVAGVYAEIKKINAARNAPAPFLRIGAAGDLFFSENYRAVLGADLAARGIERIGVITNFQTWTNHSIESIHPNTRPLMQEIVFSVDSTRPTLYEALRAGSTWERLLNGYTLATKIFPEVAYKVAYTVSKMNFQEIPAVPKKIKELFPAVSALEFHAVQNWTGNPTVAGLLLSKEERDNLIIWAQNQAPVDGMTIKFLY